MGAFCKNGNGRTGKGGVFFTRCTVFLHQNYEDTLFSVTLDAKSLPVIHKIFGILVSSMLTLFINICILP